MNRRSYLATVGAAAIAGRLSDPRAPGFRSSDDARTETPTVTGTYADQPDGPESYPVRLDEPTRDAATEYVEEFERVRTANALHRDDVEDLHASSRSVYDTAAFGGHLLLASGSGYANYADGTHADWGQAPALFFVGSDLTVRVADYDHRYFHCSEVYAADDPAENVADECEGTHGEYRAYNLHHERHGLSVTVTFLGEDGERNVLEREYDLGVLDGVKQSSVTRRRGTYRVTASLDDGATATYEWELQSAPTFGIAPVTVLVTPAGGVAVRRLPFQEI